MSGGMGMTVLPGMTAAGSSKEISWTLPSGWTEQPASAIRVGSFVIKGANGKMADVSVIPLAGEAGGDLANINRWRGQIGLPPISESDLPAESKRIRPNGKSMLFVDYPNQNAQQRVMAAIYKEGERTWFFKMMGDEQTAGAAKDDFLTFLSSLKFHGHD